MLDDVPTYALTTLALLAHGVVTFFVPSSSGEAALTMPVLAPLAELVSINRGFAPAAVLYAQATGAEVMLDGGQEMAAERIGQSQS